MLTPQPFPFFYIAVPCMHRGQGAGTESVNFTDLSQDKKSTKALEFRDNSTHTTRDGEGIH